MRGPRADITIPKVSVEFIFSWVVEPSVKTLKASAGNCSCTDSVIQVPLASVMPIVDAGGWENRVLAANLSQAKTTGCRVGQNADPDR